MVTARPLPVGFFLLQCCQYGNVLRITPLLDISKSDVDEFGRLLDLSFAAAVRETAAMRT